MEVGDLVRRSRGWLERRQSELHEAERDALRREEILERLQGAVRDRGLVVRRDTWGVQVEWHGGYCLVGAGTYLVEDLEILNPVHETARIELGLRP